MYLKEKDDVTGEALTPPIVIWESNDRYAIIAFLLLSVDKKMEADGLKKLNAFMGIDAAGTGGSKSLGAFMGIHTLETESTGDEADGNLQKLRKTQEQIICKGEAFLESLGQDENRCDCIISEIDCIIDSDTKCFNVYVDLLMHENKILARNAYWPLLSYLNLVVHDDGYTGNQKRVIRHLARKWRISRQELSILENSAKSLGSISRKRDGIQSSDMRYKEAVSALAALDAEEEAVWNTLNKLGIEKTDTAENHIIDENTQHAQDTGSGLWDRIVDHTCEGIDLMGDVLCAPFEWLTDRVIDSM